MTFLYEGRFGSPTPSSSAGSRPRGGVDALDFRPRDGTRSAEPVVPFGPCSAAAAGEFLRSLARRRRVPSSITTYRWPVTRLPSAGWGGRGEGRVASVTVPAVRPPASPPEVRFTGASRAKCCGCTGAFQALRAGSIPVARSDVRAPRGVAQSGSAPGWGPGGRRFKSCLPDYRPGWDAKCPAGPFRATNPHAYRESPRSAGAKRRRRRGSPKWSFRGAVVTRLVTKPT